jgi:hypothetical protein
MAIGARIKRLFSGFISLFISGIEKRNPEALIEAARQEFRDRMAQYNLALAQMAGIAERLKSQIGMKPTRPRTLRGVFWPITNPVILIGRKSGA